MSYKIKAVLSVLYLGVRQAIMMVLDWSRQVWHDQPGTGLRSPASSFCASALCDLLVVSNTHKHPDRFPPCCESAPSVQIFSP